MQVVLRKYLCLGAAGAVPSEIASGQAGHQTHGLPFSDRMMYRQ